MGINNISCLRKQYSAKDMDKKACDIIAAVDNLRLFIQVVSIEDKQHRHWCCSQKSRDTSF